MNTNWGRLPPLLLLASLAASASAASSHAKELIESGRDEPDTRFLRQPIADLQKLASANAGFAFKLLKQLAKEQPNTNHFISPFSAASVLQMACNGAAGQTKAEMQAVLGTTGLRPGAVNGGNRHIGKSLNRPEST